MFREIRGMVCVMALLALAAAAPARAQVAPDELLAKGSVVSQVDATGAPLITTNFYVDATMAPDGSAAGQFLVFQWDIAHHVAQGVSGRVLAISLSADLAEADVMGVSLDGRSLVHFVLQAADSEAPLGAMGVAVSGPNAFSSDVLPLYLGGVILPNPVDQ